VIRRISIAVANRLGLCGRWGQPCLSVLTDKPFFQEGFEGAGAVCGRWVELPCSAKTSILSPNQLYQARAAGADCGPC